jgi:hypothetical protein
MVDSSLPAKKAGLSNIKGSIEKRGAKYRVKEGGF